MFSFFFLTVIMEKSRLVTCLWRLRETRTEVTVGQYAAVDLLCLPKADSLAP